MSIKCCRLCLNSSNQLYHLVSFSGVQDLFHSEIFPDSNLQITNNKDDLLPTTICESCRNQIENFFEFRKILLCSHRILNQNQTNPEFNPNYLLDLLKKQLETSIDINIVCELIETGKQRKSVHVQTDLSCFLPVNQTVSENTIIPFPERLLIQQNNIDLPVTGTVTIPLQVAGFKRKYTRKTKNNLDEAENQRKLEKNDEEFTETRIDGTIEFLDNSFNTNNSEPKMEVPKLLKIGSGEIFDSQTDDLFAKKKPKLIELVTSDSGNSLNNFPTFKLNKSFEIPDLVPIQSPDKKLTILSDIKVSQESKMTPLKLQKIKKPLPIDLFCFTCMEPYVPKCEEQKHKKVQVSQNETGLKIYECVACNISYNNLTAIRHHLLVHGENLQFMCSICLDTFSRKEHLDSHIDEEHSNEGSFICEACGKCLDDRKMYREHKQSHFRLNLCRIPFSCDACPKKFRSAETLNTHRDLFHFANKMALCEKCGETFRRFGDLNKHLVDAHSCSGEEKVDIENNIQTASSSKYKYFKCNDCPTLFRYKNALDEHILNRH